MSEAIEVHPVDYKVGTDINSSNVNNVRQTNSSKDTNKIKIQQWKNFCLKFKGNQIYH